jgi:signal transduction histidine kinase
MTPSERSAHARKPSHPDEVAASSMAGAATRIEALEAEKAALEQFAALAAHELVVPLVMAESYADMVRERLPGAEHAESRQDLEALARGATRGRILVEALLREARAADRSLERTAVDLDRIVREGVQLLEPEIAARRARVEIAPLPEVLGDEALLNGLMINLLMNALKYLPRRGGAVRIQAVRELGQWRVLVGSDGPLIPETDRDRIFRDFQRARGERRAGGTGLGLAICRRIVERHGGEIGVTAAPDGSGNDFSFTLPSR